MKRALLGTCVLLTMVFSVGCNRACKDLEDVCGRCADANIQAACLSVVEESNEEDCADSVAGFEAICQ